MKTSMKTCIQLLIFVSGIMLSSCSISKTTPETISKVKSNVTTQNFKINIDKAIPMRMRPVNLTSSYDFKLKGDSAFAYLPYYGVAHSAPFGSSEGGIRFAEPVTDYNYSSNSKKRNHNFTFKVKSGSNNYQVNIEIFENGSSTVNINSFDRDAITFYGNMELDK